MSGTGILAVQSTLARARRVLDALEVRVAGSIGRRSDPELGPDGLARSQGYRSAAALIAAETGGSLAEAVRLVSVGEATAPRPSFSSGCGPARHPHVATALQSGCLSVEAAVAITRMLDRVSGRADPVQAEQVEKVLATRSAGLTLDQLLRLVKRAEAYLDADGAAPRDEDRHLRRSLRIRQTHDGMLVFDGVFDAESGAPLKVAVEALVTHWLRANRSGPSAGEDDRTLAQMQADALAALAQHSLGCESRIPGLNSVSIVVRTGLADFEGTPGGTGTATIDGIDQPISASAMRRAAASAGIIPIVLGGPSEVLDLGRQKRYFTKAQRIALGERDGGCASCGLPPGYTEAHHVRWWKAHDGPTDLDNGVLLCSACHHRQHREGWSPHIKDGKVWFIPPAHVDPSRTPRLGGRARFDFTVEDISA